VGFDPRDYVDKQLPGLDVLREELDTIYNNVDDTLHQILSDSTLLENKDILEDSLQGLLTRFNNGGEELSPANASRLVEIVVKLHEGIRRITISEDDIRKVLNRPMTPDDAVKAFRKYISSLIVGGEGDNIRIVLK
jgi:translation initiation factor 2 beta subunit (eIF-2beta)/eIF-5